MGCWPSRNIKNVKLRAQFAFAGAASACADFTSPAFFNAAASCWEKFKSSTAALVVSTSRQTGNFRPVGVSDAFA
jgi:hypothetical protein